MTVHKEIFLNSSTIAYLAVYKNYVVVTVTVLTVNEKIKYFFYTDCLTYDSREEILMTFIGYSSDGS